MDKLAALRTFRAVVEQQSFSRAARALGLSNAATSKHVRELEEVLGAQLLQRTTRRMSLTATGRSYYEHIVAALEALAEADRSARDQAATPRGTLRVAAPMTLGLTGVSSAIAAFSLTHPQVELELSLDDRVVDLVREGFDVCIRGGGALPDSDLVARKLVNLERVVVAAPSYLGQAGTPRTPADLAAHRCLVYSLSASPTRWTFTRQAERQSVDVAGPLRVNNSLALVQAVVVGP